MNSRQFFGQRRGLGTISTPGGNRPVWQGWLLAIILIFGPPTWIGEVAANSHESPSNPVSDLTPTISGLKQGLLPIQQKIMDLLATQPHSALPDRAACFAPGTTEKAMMDYYRTNPSPILALPFRPNARWTTTATDGSGIAQGTPITLTWGILNDGAATESGEPVSDLKAFLNGIYGNQAVWQALMQQVFDRWTELTGITYVFEANDDGAIYPNSPGVLGVRADVRIGGHLIDGPSNVLAYNYFPNTGDMIIDTADTFYADVSNNSLKFRNVFSHEHGHGIGLGHTCPASQTKLMEPFVSTQYDGPQHDDILSANRNYGDRLGANNNSATASAFGTLGDVTLNTTNLSLATSGDVDFYSFQTTAGSRKATVTIVPVGFTYLEAAQNSDGSCPVGTSFNSLTLRDLSVEVIDSNGSTVLGSASTAAAGQNEVLSDVDLGGGTGPFFIRVFGNAADNVQMYDLILTLADGTPQAEMAILGNGIEIADGDTTPSFSDGTDLGLVLQGSSTNVSFIITNSGTLPLNLPSAPVISGAAAADFTASFGATPLVIPPNGSGILTVSFTPAATGSRDATISIANDDLTENPYDFAISGTGSVVPEIGLLGNGVDIVNGSTTPSPLDNTDFGGIDIAVGTSTKFFFITNSGTTNLNITLPITISGTNASDFTVVTNPATFLTPQSATPFAIRFDAGAAGTRSATVSIASDDADENPFTFNIAGLGTLASEIEVEGNGQLISDGDTTPGVGDGTDLGSADISGGATTSTYLIRNLGSAALTINLPIVIVGSTLDFQVTKAPDVSVPVGGSTTMEITFDPALAGLRSATVLVYNDDGDESPFDFAVQGTGVLVPELAVLGNGVEIVDGDVTPDSADHTDFGDVILAAGSQARTFTLTNQGSLALTVTLPIAITGPAASDFAVSVNPATTIEAGTATSLEVVFTPTAAGSRTATVTFGNSDGNENPYSFAIGGNATQAEVALLGNSQLISDGDLTPRTADNTDFGSADVTAESITKAFVITNSGDAELTITLPLDISGPAAAEFQLTSIPATAIPPGLTSTFEITFNPVGTGPRNATVSFGNTDANENPYDFAITGTGTGPDIQIVGGTTPIADGETNTVFTNRTDFGTNTVGSVSTTNTFVIRNAGAGTLRLTPPITIQGDGAADFTVSAQPGTNALIAGAATTFDVVFHPLTGGQRFATVNIVNLDSDENPYDFAISGLGAGPEVSVIGNSITITNGANVPSITNGTSFGAADLNSGTLIRQYTVTNEGTTNLNITLPLSFIGTAAGDYSVVANPPASIAAGGSGTFRVSFDPSAAGSRSAFVILNSDDADESAFSFAIEGIGFVVPPTITSHPAGKNLNALESTTLFVGANGTSPLSYQWYQNGSPITGATGPALILNNLTTANGGVYHATVSNIAGSATSSSAQITVNLLPTVTSWSNPSPIVYGTLLGSAQLNAVASVPGTFVYAPSLGARLNAGAGQTLGVAFTPANPLVYQASAAMVTIDVTPAALTLRADDQSRLINTGNPALTFSGTGFVLPDNISSLDLAPSLSTTATAGSPAGNYPIAVTDGNDANYTISRADGTLLVFAEAPAIVQQPANLTVDALTDVNFAVVATGIAPLTYQWKKDGADLPGATGASLALNAVTPNAAGSYSVEVVNGQGTVSSSAATLVVNRLNPIITWATPANIVYGSALGGSQLNAAANVAGVFDYSANPAGQFLSAGPKTLGATFTPTDTLNYNSLTPSVNLVVNNATLTIGVENETREYGTPNPTFTVTYSGFVNDDTVVNLTSPATASTGANGTSLPGAHAVTVSGATGSNYDYSYVPGTLTVFATAPSITVEPTALRVTLGDPAAFSVTASGTSPLSYQWRLAGTDLPGKVTAALNIGTTALTDAGPYDVIVSNVGGSVTSVVAGLTVLIPPSISVPPASVTVDAGGIATFTVSSLGSTPLRYQWTKDGVTIPGQTSQTLLLSNISGSDAGDYRVVVSNDAGTATSAVATLVVNLVAPTITWISPSPISYGTALAESQLNATANVPGSFAYTPPLGTVLAGGSQSLSVLFTPLDGGRYAPATVNRPITIQPVPLIVTPNNSSREIGLPNPPFTVSYSGFVNGDDASALTTAPIASSTADTVTPIGTYVITATGGVSPSYTFSYASGTLTIVAIPASISTQPVDLVVNQGHTALFSVAAAGSPTLNYQWRRHGTNLVGETAATLSIVNIQAADDAPYDVVVSNPANSITSSIVTLDVLLPSTVTWADPGNLTYGTALSATQLNASAAVPGTITYGQAIGTILPAGSHTLSLNFVPNDTAVYLPTNSTVNLTVVGAPLTVTATDLSREFGNANPALIYTFSGFVNGEDANALTSQPATATGADPASIPGNYTISVSGAVGANYQISHVPGTLTVFANAPSVTTPPLSLTVTNGDNATFGTSVSGTLPLHLQWRKNGVALPGENTTTLTVVGAQVADAGAYDLVATNIAGTVTSATATLDVVVPPVITLQPVSQIFNALSDVTFTVTATGTSPLNYQWRRNGQPVLNATNSSLSLTGVTPAAVGAYSVTVVNVAGAATSDTATLSVNELAPDITWNAPQAISYGSPLSSVQLNATTFIPGTFTYTPPAGTFLASGNHTLNVAFVPDDTTNFVATNAAVQLSVNKASLGVVADNVSREYNQPNPPLTISYSGFVNGDNSSSLTAIPTIDTTATADSLPGNYPITISGATAANYDITHTGGNLTVFANAPNVTLNPASLTTVSTLNAAFSVQATGTAPITYQWRHQGTNLPTETNANLAITAVDPLINAGSYDVVLANIAGSRTSLVATLTVLVSPAITSQPLDVTTNALGSAAFSVAATGTAPLRYQWRRDGLTILNATNASLTLSGVRTNEAGAYTVIVSNGAGSITSATANLAVNQLDSIVTWPTPAAITYGTPLGSAQLSATANTAGSFTYTPAVGTLLPAGSHSLSVNFIPDDAANYLPSTRSVNLQVNPATLTVAAINQSREFGQPNPALTVTFSGFVNGENENIVSPAPVLSTSAGVTSGLGDYTIAISGAAAPNYAVTHVPGTLNVFGHSPVIQLHPVDRTTVSGTDVSFTNTATGTAPLSFQWRKGGIPVTDATNAILNLTNVHLLDSGGYDVVVSNIAGLAISFPAVLNVLVPPNFVLEPTNTVVSVGQPTALISAATGTAPIGFQWFRDGAPIPNQTNATLSFVAPTTNDTAAYRVVAANAAGVSTGRVASITVNQTPTIQQAPANRSVLAGQPLILNAQAFGDGTLTYVWSRAGTIVQTSTSSTLVVGNAGLSEVGLYEVTVTNSFGQAQSLEFLITLDGPPQIVTQPTDIAVTPGTNVAFEVLASGSQPLLYAWFRNGEALPAANARTLSVTNITLADAGLYSVAVANALGVVVSVPASLSVIAPPLISVHPTNRLAAVGGSIDLIVQAESAVPPAYQWQYEGQSIPNATNASFSLSGIQLADSGDYQVFITNSAGVATSAVATVTAMVPPTFLQQPVASTATLGQNATISAQAAGNAPLAYQWQRNGVDLPGLTSPQLLLTNLQRLHEGNYALRVSNPVGTNLSQNAILRVLAPQILDNVSGGRHEQFRLHFGDQSGNSLKVADAPRFVIEVSADLVTWSLLSTNGIGLTYTNGQFRFEDLGSVILPQRFYRVREQ
jgi:hypothetical protein